MAQRRNRPSGGGASPGPTWGLPSKSTVPAGVFNVQIRPPKPPKSKPSPKPSTNPTNARPVRESTSGPKSGPVPLGESRPGPFRGRGVATTKKKAVISIAESKITPAEVEATLPAQAPYRGGQGPTPTPPPIAPYKPGYVPPNLRTSEPSVDKRYGWAVASIVSPKARAKLAASMDPADKLKKIVQGKAAEQAAADEHAATVMKPVYRAHYLQTVAAVRSGKMTEAEAGDYLKAMGLPDSKNPYVESGNLPGDAWKLAQHVPLIGVPAAIIRDPRHGPQAALNSIIGPVALGVGAVKGAAPLALYPGEKVDQLLAGGRQRQATPIEQQAGLVPDTPAVEHGLGQAIRMIPKIAVGGAGAIAALSEGDPAAWKGVAVDLYKTLTGVSQLAGLANASVVDPKDGYKIGAQTVQGLWQQALEQYGPDTTYGQVLAESKRHPLIYGTNALGLATPGVRAVLALLDVTRGTTLAEGLSKISGLSKLHSGEKVGFKEAWRNTYFPKGDRILRYQTLGTERAGTGAWFKTAGKEAGEVVPVRISQAKNPITRGTLQAGYDAVSKIVNHLGPLRKLPISESKRAATAMRKQLDRKLRRLPAEVQAAFVDISKAISGDDNEHYATALATMLQKPNGFTQEEWVSAVIEDMKGMLANPSRFHLPDQPLSPAMQRRVNEISGLETKAQAALLRRRDVAHRSIRDEQGRLGGVLDEVISKQRAVEDERARVEKDTTLNAEDKANELAHLDAESKVLETQLGVARQQLERVTVDKTPIEAPNRDALRARLEQLKYFTSKRASGNRVDDALALTDAVARRWASQVPGRDPADWYAMHPVTGEAADLPSGPGSLLYHQLGVDHITSPLRPSDKEILTNANRARQVRAQRRGEPTYSHLKADGTEAVRNVPARAADVHANVPTFDDQGRLLFGGETQYPDLQARWEEGYQRSFPNATPEEIRQHMLDAASFYEEKVFPFLGRVLSTREVQAWLASQKGASPARGLLDLTKTIEKVIRREDLGPDEIGLAAQTMAKIIYGNRDIAEGAAAKLTDFADVGHVQTASRTFTGHHPGTGVPYVADRWEARAKGKVDADFIETLYREHDKALQSQGYISRANWEGLRKQASDGATAWAEKRNAQFERDGVKVKGEIRKTTMSERDAERDRQLRALEQEWQKRTGDKVILPDSGGGLGATGYEHVSDWGHGLVDHLNATKYLGKEDWNAASGQALDWAGFQHYVGAAPENVDWALFSQEKPVSFEIEGVGRLAKKFPQLKGLPADAKFALNKYIVDHVVDLAAQRTGVIPLRTTIGYGGWLTHVSPAMRVGVLAGARSYRNFLDFLREVTGEAEVFGVEGGSRGAYTEIAVRAEALKDPQVLQSLWQGLRDAHPEFSGFTPDPAGGLTSVLIAEDGAPVARVGAAFEAAVGATLKRLEESLGTDDLKVEFRAVSPVRSTRQKSAIDQYLEDTYGHVPEPSGRPGASGRQYLRGGGEAARKTEARFRASRADKASVDAKIQEALDIYDSEGVAGLEQRANVAGRIDDPAAVPHTTRDPEPGRAISATDLKFSKVTGEPISSVLHLNQARGQDILGSTAWLASDPGRRMIYLAENADFSTFVHEMFGHATEEMRASFPDEFQAVERQMNKPYADWTEADHEQFARWMENYFRTGYAPTPELVPIFDRVKGWMRSIYAGLVRTLGGRIPVQTRQLFDSYFGANMDENVWRVATAMGNEKWDPAITGDMAYGIQSERLQKQMASIQKGIDTRAYNRTLDAASNRLDGLTRRMNALHEKGEEMTPEEFDEYTQLCADVLLGQAEIVVRADKREQALRSKVSDLEKSLAKGFDNRRFQGALAAMRFIAQDREDILRKAFGDHYDAVFENRRDLLAEWLVSKGLLKADYEKGAGFYYPMTMERAWLRRGLKLPARPLTGDVIGKTKTDLLNLHRQNNMILWQRGDWNADPAVLVEAHARAQSYSFMNEVKDLLWQMGREITYDERQNFPPDMYILNPDGTAISTELRRQLNDPRLGAAEDANKIQDGLSLDEEALVAKLADYFNNFAIDPNHLPDDFLQGNHKHLRVIPKGVVHTVLRPLSGGSTGVTKVWDAATTMARFATIYANAPGYMIANGANNVLLNFAQMGAKLPWAISRAQKLLHNKKLATQVFGRTGDLPYEAAIERGRNYGEGVLGRKLHLKQAEDWYLSKLATVDRFPRAWAWVHAAGLRGYKSEEDLFHLLKGATAKTRRDGELIDEEATQHMIDFNRPRDWERKHLSRVLFIWPYIRGATAWPFWYAKNYPDRVAIANLAGQQLQARQKRMLGPVPYWYRDLFPISTSGNRAAVVNGGLISPTSAAEQELQLIHDTVAGLLGKKPDDQTASWVDMFTPVLRDAIQLSTGQSPYGTSASLKDLMQGVVFGSTIPGYRIADAIIHWDDAAKTPRIYQHYSGGLKDDAIRTILRAGPLTASIHWLNEQAQTHADVPTSVRIQQRTALAEKEWKALKLGPVDQSLPRAVSMKVTFEDWLKEYSRKVSGTPDFEPTPVEGGGWSTKYEPSTFEQAVGAWNVMKQQIPGWIDSQRGLLSPIAQARALGIAPGSATADVLGKGYMGLFNAWTSLPTKVGTATKETGQAKRIEAEQPVAARRLSNKQAMAALDRRFKQLEKSIGK